MLQQSDDAADLICHRPCEGLIHPFHTFTAFRDERISNALLDQSGQALLAILTRGRRENHPAITNRPIRQSPIGTRNLGAEFQIIDQADLPIARRPEAHPTQIGRGEALEGIRMLDRAPQMVGPARFTLRPSTEESLIKRGAYRHHRVEKGEAFHHLSIGCVDVDTRRRIDVLVNDRFDQTYPRSGANLLQPLDFNQSLDVDSIFIHMTPDRRLRLRKEWIPRQHDGVLDGGRVERCWHGESSV